MEKTLFLTVLAVFTVLGSVSSVPNSKFLLRELIRELEDTQVDNAAPVEPTVTPSNVETELENIGDLTGLNDNGEEGETTGEEGTPTEAQEADAGETEQGDETEGPTAGEGDNTGEANQGGETEEEGPTTGEGETGGTEQEGETAGGNQEGGEDTTNGEEAKLDQDGGENAEEDGEEVDDEASEEGLGEHPNVDDGKQGLDSDLPENETPFEPIGGDEGSSLHLRPSTLEKSAVRVAQLLDNLSQVLTNRADTLSRIDKVLMEGPDLGYPNSKTLAAKQEKLEVMAAKVGEMKKVLSRFFDDVYNRFNNLLSDDRDDGNRIETHGPVTDSPNPIIEDKPDQPEESLPDKTDSADVQQRQLLQRLLNVLRSDSKPRI